MSTFNLSVTSYTLQNKILLFIRLILNNQHLKWHYYFYYYFSFHFRFPFKFFLIGTDATTQTIKKSISKIKVFPKLLTSMYALQTELYFEVGLNWELKRFNVIYFGNDTSIVFFVAILRGRDHGLQQKFSWFFHLCLFQVQQNSPGMDNKVCNVVLVRQNCGQPVLWQKFGKLEI